jgi:hypothetical protein
MGGRAGRVRRLGAYSGDQFREFEGLGQVVVGTQVKALDPVLEAAGSGQHEDAQITAAQLTAQIVTVGPGEIAVEKDDVVLVLPGEFGGGRTVVGHVDREADIAQPLSDRVGEHPPVFDYEQSHGARPDMPGPGHCGTRR